MGYEARCKVRVTDAHGAAREADGTVLLETDELVVRGDARTRVPRAAIRDATLDARHAGRLTVTYDGGTLTLLLGDAAAKWRDRILTPPKARIDKLDVKPGARVWISSVTDASLLEEVRTRTSDVSADARASRDCDVVFVQVDTPAQMTRVAAAARALKRTGALWVVHPKGVHGVLDTDVFAAAKAAGLTYAKVARFSDTHTAEKLVWPKASR